LADRCPIQDWPDADPGRQVTPHPALRRDPDPGRAAGPEQPWISATPDAVWLTAESLGDSDPASAAHPDLPAVFVFDEPLLSRLRLSGKRLIFLAETLAETAAQRPLEVHLGDPRTVLRGRDVAVTFAPVPGFAVRAAVVHPVQMHPFPWVVRPGPGPLTSYAAWRKGLGRQETEPCHVPKTGRSA
jgi:deoxyribodipyrimidine photo-lyase